ncbi:unnamed protein product [Spodoptera exigua]|nr:unnamed protein product [Spodoptera exigua]
MSVPRTRKVVASEDGPRARHPVVAKSSPDSIACNVRTNPQPLRSRSKNKIPKSVRYDLENALVSLCDVWFEEIKPHLVRNNIKLHVHGSNAGGDHQRVPEPAPTAPEAPASPGCSHLDPASSAAECELCRLLFNAANCIESAVCQAANAQPSPPVTASFSATDSSRMRTGGTPDMISDNQSTSPKDIRNTKEENQSHNCEEKKLERPRRRRRHRRSQPEASRRVRRLCHTYRAQGADAGRSASHAPTSQPSAPTSSRDHYV